jgi:uncharacterized protein (DUF1501 family)
MRPVSRRHALASLASVGGLGGLGTLAGLAATLPRTARTAGEDYRALVVVWLDGGNDGHNVLIPDDDTSYAEYKAGRGGLAIARDRLSALPNPVNGKRYGLHPNLAPLVPLYSQGRLAFLANVGWLERPVTTAALRAGTAELPPYFGLHVEQSLLIQGATPHADTISGWAGRGLEALPPELRHANAALGAETNAYPTPLVQGERTVATRFNNSRQTWMGWGDAADPNSGVMLGLGRMQRWQQENLYAAEYQRSAMRTLGDAALGRIYDGTPEPAGDFGNGAVRDQLRGLARVLPKFKEQGLRRQVFQLVLPNLDTHRAQIGDWYWSQDNQLTQLAKALSAFDAALRTAGMDNNVVTLVMSEFGRTLRPAGAAEESGSEHGWGNHWWAFGGPVAGGTIHGTFPSLALNGADDLDGTGILVPTMASDQVAAAVLQWLGVPAASLTSVLPNLANFTQKSVPLLRA